MTIENPAQLDIGGSQRLLEGTVLQVHCAGAWTVQGIAALDERLEVLSWPEAPAVVIDGSAISVLDTSGAWLLHRTVRSLEKLGRKVRVQGLRAEFASLLQLIAAREIAEAVAAPAAPGWLERLGRHAWLGLLGTLSYLSFVGESFTVLLRALLQPRRLRWRPILHNV